MTVAKGWIILWVTKLKSWRFNPLAFFMLQEFIKEINWLYPRLKPKAIYKMFCSMKGREKKYWIFGMGKRDWAKFFISERQMQYFINVMIDYWFLEIKWEVSSNRRFRCRVFKASKQLLEYFKQIKDVVLVKCSNLTDRIKDWNNSNDISSFFTIQTKYRKQYFKYDGVIYILWKDRYKGVIYDTMNNKGIKLFDFINMIWDNNIIKTAIKLKIIW